MAKAMPNAMIKPVMIEPRTEFSGFISESLSNLLFCVAGCRTGIV